MVGVVVGVFRHGVLAGRLRVEGEYSVLPYKGRLQERIAVYAIPPCAVRECRGRLVLGVTFQQARGRWLVHVREPQGL
jgi:hypothetical protein